ncbi:hypothetical protein BDAP_001844 [Binucleata daphniae]
MFVEGLADKTKIIYKYAADEKFRLDAVLKAAFEDVKRIWKQKLELDIPDLEKNFELEIYASDIGTAGLFRQVGEPVAFISRVLRGA